MTIEDLAAELATYQGFRAHVEPRSGFLRNAGAGIGVLGLLLFAGAWASQDLETALGVLAGCAAVAIALLLLGGVRERSTLRPLHAAYLSRGWLATQVPTGLVLDNSGDGAAVVRRDSLLEHGRPDAWPAIVLIHGRGQSAEALEAAATASRTELDALDWSSRIEITHRVRQELVGGDGDASRVFPVPAGTLLAERVGSSPYVVVVPAERRSRRARCYAVRMPREHRARGRDVQRA